MEQDVRKKMAYAGDFGLIQIAVLRGHCATCPHDKCCTNRQCWETKFGEEAYRYYSTYRLQPTA
jgi:hypothetical protein